MKRRHARPASRIPLTDIHSHVLPALDDGPETYEESVELLRQAYDGGTRTIVATPHLFRPPLFDYPPEAVYERFANLQEYLTDLSLDPEFAFLREITVCLGAEHYASEGFFRALEDDALITLNGRSAFLLEFPMDFTGDEMLHATRRASRRGLIPVLAHLERYPAVRDDPALAGSLAKRGCVFQINADSVCHMLGPRRTAMALLRTGLTATVASDAHGAASRPANLHDAEARLTKAFDAEQARRWVQTMPSTLLGRLKEDALEFDAGERS